jgi:carbon starvation protein
VDAAGKSVAVWRVFWELFGASNQLLAALTLLGVTVWLWRTRRAVWVWFVTGLPTVWMYFISMWALGEIIGRHVEGLELPTTPVPYVAAVLVLLGGLMLIEALRMLVIPAARPPAAEASVIPA